MAINDKWVYSFVNKKIYWFNENMVEIGSYEINEPMKNPVWLYVDQNGDVFVGMSADKFEIRKYNYNFSNLLLTFTTDDPIDWYGGMVLDDAGNVLVQNGEKIFKFTSSAQYLGYTTITGLPEPLDSQTPSKMTIDENQNIYMMSSKYSETGSFYHMHKFDKNLTYITTFDVTPQVEGFDPYEDEKIFYKDGHIYMVGTYGDTGSISNIFLMKMDYNGNFSYKILPTYNEDVFRASTVSNSNFLAIFENNTHFYVSKFNLNGGFIFRKGPLNVSYDIATKANGEQTVYNPNGARWYKQAYYPDGMGLDLTNLQETYELLNNQNVVKFIGNTTNNAL